MPAPVTLASLFLPHLREPADEAPQSLEPILAQLFQSARAAWPSVELPAARFLPYLAQRAEPEASSLTAIHAGDLYLACACFHGDPKALRCFEQRMGGKLAAFVARVDHSPQFVDDVRQLLFEKLFVGGERAPRIADYTGQGSLEGWVRVAALRTALNLRRDVSQAATPDHAEDHRMLASQDPELHFVRQRSRDQFRAAFIVAVAALSSQQRQVMRLHFVDGLSLEKIAALHQVNRTTVWRWIIGARATLTTGIRDELRARLDHSSGELEDLLDQVPSQLDLSLGGLLRSAPQ